MNMPTIRVLLVVAAAGLSMRSTALAADPVKPAVPKPYSSPQAAFDAYRKAHETKDWRTFYQCLAPAARREALFEAHFACGVCGGPKVEAMLKQYHPTDDEFAAVYDNRYAQKHGQPPRAGTAKESRKSISPVAPPKADSSAAAREVEDKSKLVAIPGPTRDAPPAGYRPPDRELMVTVLAELVKDDVGFFASATEATYRENAEKIGQLDNVVIHGDTAVGRLNYVYFIESFSKEGPAAVERHLKQQHNVTKELHFRKLNGSWLIEQGVW